MTPTSLHMSSPVTPKNVMNSLEQESLGESIRGSTTEGVPKMFHYLDSLAEIYADTLEEELNLDELVLLVDEEPTTYREVANETMW